VPDGAADLYRQVLEICAAATEIRRRSGGFHPGWAVGHGDTARAVSAVGRERVPIIGVWMGGESAEEGRRILTGAVVPITRPGSGRTRLPYPLIATASISSCSRTSPQDSRPASSSGAMKSATSRPGSAAEPCLLEHRLCRGS
jgi:hypothetical protein